MLDKIWIIQLQNNFLSYDQIPEDTIGENEAEKLDIVDYYSNPLLLNMGMSIPLRSCAVSTQPLQNVSINSVDYNDIRRSVK